jgi:hypothetical protein
MPRLACNVLLAGVRPGNTITARFGLILEPLWDVGQNAERDGL